MTGVIYEIVKLGWMGMEDESVENQILFLCSIELKLFSFFLYDFYVISVERIALDKWF